MDFNHIVKEVNLSFNLSTAKEMSSYLKPPPISKCHTKRWIKIEIKMLDYQLEVEPDDGGKPPKECRGLGFLKK